MVVAYEACDWNIQVLPQLFAQRIGEVFQYVSYKTLKQEYEKDCEEIIYKSYK